MGRVAGSRSGEACLVTANGKMRACGDAGLEFRVSRVRV